MVDLDAFSAFLLALHRAERRLPAFGHDDIRLHTSHPVGPPGDDDRRWLDLHHEDALVPLADRRGVTHAADAGFRRLLRRGAWYGVRLVAGRRPVGDLFLLELRPRPPGDCLTPASVPWPTPMVVARRTRLSRASWAWRRPRSGIICATPTAS